MPIVAADISKGGLAETEVDCPAGSVTSFPVDVTDRDAVVDFAEAVRRDVGPASMVFNNAGVDLVARVHDMSWQDFDWLMAINVGGVVNGTKAFLPQLIESGTRQRPARLVNLSSAFGLIAVPHQSAYSTSKFAVRGFTEALRQEMIIERHPVTVHSVHPGVIRTNFGANMRVAEADTAAEQTRQMFERAALTSPQKAARVILRGAERNRARILIGPDGRVAAALPRILGAGYVGLLARAARLGTTRTKW